MFKRSFECFEHKAIRNKMKVTIKNNVPKFTDRNNVSLSVETHPSFTNYGWKIVSSIPKNFEELEKMEGVGDFDNYVFDQFFSHSSELHNKKILIIFKLISFGEPDIFLVFWNFSRFVLFDNSECKVKINSFEEFVSWSNKNGDFHREDGPAEIMYAGGNPEKKMEQWFYNGLKHRKDGPATIYYDGYKEWWINDKLHNENGPAVIYPDGEEEYWENGKSIPGGNTKDGYGLERMIVKDDLTKYYFKDRLHREDGPAVIFFDKEEGKWIKEWWINGNKLKEEKELPVYKVVNENNRTIYYKDGKFHREDGPAVIYKNDHHKDYHELWYKDGKLHRENGPAVVYPNEVQKWYKDGKLHREDGPAVVFFDGRQEWYKNGEKCSCKESFSKNEQKWSDVVKISNKLIENFKKYFEEKRT